jgi:hypothetical protein
VEAGSVETATATVAEVAPEVGIEEVQETIVGSVDFAVVIEVLIEEAIEGGLGKDPQAVSTASKKAISPKTVLSLGRTSKGIKGEHLPVLSVAKTVIKKWIVLNHSNIIYTDLSVI